jgi:transposase
MEYFAKIFKKERISKQFWRYTFLDVKTDKTDWFINNYRINYISGLVGRLKLSWDKNEQCKLYQGFDQNIADLKEVGEEESLGLWEEKFEKKISGLEEEITCRPINFFKTYEELVEFLKGLHDMDKNWIKTAKRFKKTDRTLRRWRKNPIAPLRKVGRKFKIDRKSFYHLIYSIQTEKAKMLKEVSNCVFKETHLRLSVSTIYRVLKKIGYSYQVIHYRHPQQKQNLPEVVDFMEKVGELPPRQLLATDESGHPLNLAPRKSWGLKGQKITKHKPSYGTNYSLLLLIRNVEKQGIIYWELIKGSVGTDIFHGFLANVKLPADEKHYLLLDNISFHKSNKIKELLANKNTEPRYIVASNPCLNPTELLFNVIKQYVKSCEPRTEEELRKVISEKINKLQEEDLGKYFKDCLDFDFVFKSGH